MSELDVATALACGARGVFLGRPVLYALAAAGDRPVITVEGRAYGSGAPYRAVRAPLRVRADRIKLSRVIGNLLGNVGILAVERQIERDRGLRLRPPLRLLLAGEVRAHHLELDL